MGCCNHCVDAGDIFGRRHAQRDVRHYRKKGPRVTTRLLLDGIASVGHKTTKLLDIGSGVGAIPHELLKSGLDSATVVDASAAYLQASEEEALRRGHRERFTYYHGDFVELANTLPAADTVTLDRVICCYPDMERLVDASTVKAVHAYGLVYPRERWIIKTGARVVNFFLWLRGGAFRAYVHSSAAVDAAVRRNGFRRNFYARTFLWQVVVYERV